MARARASSQSWAGVARELGFEGKGGIKPSQQRDVLTRAKDCGVDVEYLTDPGPRQHSNKIQGCSREKLCEGLIMCDTWAELRSHLGYISKHNAVFKQQVRAMSQFNIKSKYLDKFTTQGISNTNLSARSRDIWTWTRPDHRPQYQNSPQATKTLSSFFKCWLDVDDPDNYDVDPSDPRLEVISNGILIWKNGLGLEIIQKHIFSRDYVHRINQIAVSPVLSTHIVNF